MINGEKVVYSKELIRDGDFRLAQNSSPNAQGNDVVVQHHHPDGPEQMSGLTFNDNGWVYCWYASRRCAECDAKVPLELTGIHNMIAWER